MSKEGVMTALFALGQLQEAQEPKGKGDREVKRQLDELVGAMADPLIVHSCPWADTIPDWLKAQVKVERLIALMKCHGNETTATDAEALAYLMPASLEAPLDHEWTQIYLYLSTKVCEAAGKKIPDDIRTDTLAGWEFSQLADLKQWIYRKRVESRPKEKREAAKKEEKQEEALDRRPFEAVSLFD